MRALSLLCLLLTVPSLAQQRELVGRVVDQDGAPLADVAVCLIDTKGDPFLTKDVARQPLTTTGIDGRYKVVPSEALDDARHRLLYVRRGRVHVAGILEPRDGWPIVLPRAHTLAGRVVDHEGNPAANVRVEARDWLWQARYRSDEATLDWLPQPRTAVLTNGRGRFILPGTMSSGVQLIAGEAFLRSNPVALGDPIELVLPKKGAHTAYGRRYSSNRKPKPEAAEQLLKLVGKAKFGNLPRYGASLQFVQLQEGKDGKRVRVEQEREYRPSVPLTKDGAFEVSLAPGSYRTHLVLPRAFRQGPPDLVELKTVEVQKGQETLSLDLQPHMPLQVAGTVRSSVPAGRMVVGAAVKFPVHGHFYGYTHFECALATVAPDGRFAMQIPPGDCTFFVIDMWTGMMLHREAVRTFATGDEPKLAFEVVAGGCDVKLAGDVAKLSWIEMLVPDEWIPKGIDRISSFGHEYTKRIGCMIPPRTREVRLYLPPMSTDLWFVASSQGDLKLPRGEVAIDVVAGKVSAATLPLPGK